MSFHVPELQRVTAAMCQSWKWDWEQLRSDRGDGNNGPFLLTAPLPDLHMFKGHRTPRRRLRLFCIASDGMGWEHVSVSVRNKNPSSTWRRRPATYEEMCCVKSTFWDEDDRVAHLWVPVTEHVNIDEHTLHLWRPSPEHPWHTWWDNDALWPHRIMV